MAPNGWDSLEGLLSRHGASIVFNGHAHIYQRKERYRLVSYTTGGGGARLAPIGVCSATTAFATGWSNTHGVSSSCNAPKPTNISDVSHFLLVDVAGSRVTLCLTEVLDQQTYDFSLKPGDTAPPSAPGAVVVTAMSESGLAVSWGESSDDVGVAGYSVYPDGEQVVETAGTTHTLVGLSCGTPYEVSVEAFECGRRHLGADRDDGRDPVLRGGFGRVCQRVRKRGFRSWRMDQ